MSKPATVSEPRSLRGAVATLVAMSSLSIAPTALAQEAATAPATATPTATESTTTEANATATTEATPATTSAPEARTGQEQERAGTSRRGYAWGEAAAEASSSDTSLANFRYATINATLGLGGSLRPLQYLDLGGPQHRFAPLYVQARGTYFLESTDVIRHGITAGLATNLCTPTDAGCTGDGPDNNDGFDALWQWTVSVGYTARLLMLGDIVQPYGRIAPSLAISRNPSMGVELAVGSYFMPLHHIGAYAELSVSTYFTNDVHPLISLEVGATFDWELLP